MLILVKISGRLQPACLRLKPSIAQEPVKSLFTYFDGCIELGWMH